MAPDVKLLKSFQNNMKIVEKFLLKHNVNVDKIKRVSKNLSEELSKEIIKKLIRGEGVTEKLKLSLKQSSDRIVQDNEGDLKRLMEQEENKMSVVLLIIVFIVNTVIVNIIYNLIKERRTALIIGAVSVAPIVEELAKKFSIEEGFGRKFIFLFSTSEALLYLGSFISYVLASKYNKKASVAIAKFMFIRGIGMVMHFTTYAIQNYFYKLAKKENNSTYIYYGISIAICIHSLYNVLAVIFAKKINSFIFS